jgi:hypothetical protein
MTIPTAEDVVTFLNEQLTAAGSPRRVTSINVLPYVNPMWLANWEAAELAGDEFEELIREARWQFPQVLVE